jgi:hypothetical protein
VVRPEVLLLDREGAAAERLGSVELALNLQQRREAVQRVRVRHRVLAVRGQRHVASELSDDKQDFLLF